MKTLGEKLKNIRTSKNISLRALGEAAHIKHSYIKDLESGRRTNPSADIVVALATALGVLPSELIDEKSDNVAEVQPIYAGSKPARRKKTKKSSDDSV